jgi:hypothetical protein
MGLIFLKKRLYYRSKVVNIYSGDNRHMFLGRFSFLPAPGKISGALVLQ